MIARRTLLATALAGLSTPAFAQSRRRSRGPKSAIFLHPDGMGANTWMAARLLAVGPDGRLAWDRLPATAVYVGPMSDSVTASSNGGATSHAWGVRADSASFGMVGGARIARARSGASVPLMLEAKAAGKAIGLVNSALVTEAGTGAMVAVSANRRNHDDIAAQMLAARPQVMLGGGEQHFLPAGVAGRHGPGVRTDGRDLISEARAAGYRTVFTSAELAAAPVDTTPLLGLFAAGDTYNGGSEALVQGAGKPLWLPSAPTWDVAVEAALARLALAAQGYFLVANHEATDDLGGDNNAQGVIEGALQADRAIAAALARVSRDPNLTLVVASDSDCGGLIVTGDDAVAGTPVPERGENGSPQDGEGAERTPWLAAPDKAGRRHPFLVTWAAAGDTSGATVARGIGPGASVLQGTVDSTDVYEALHRGLFAR
jgi:alkaline phosphatase